MKRILIGSILLSAVSCTQVEKQTDLTAYVDPFIGTAYVGHTHPAAQMPFGMVQLGPDTGSEGWEHCSGYYDEDTSILGFSHTHLSGTGVPEMGDILFMPVVGEVGFEPGSAEDTSTGYRSRFSHESEAAAPGYYKVHLDDYNIGVELTTTPRVGYHKYTYPQSDRAGLLIDLHHGLEEVPIESNMTLINDTVLVGKRRSKGWSLDHTYYFYAVLSKPVSSVTSYVDGVTGDAKAVEGVSTKMHLKFDTEAGEVVTAKVALSTVSVEGAEKNLLAEAAGHSFEDVRNQATKVWNEYLSKIEIEPMNADQQISFYTSLYHALLMPNLVSDVDGTCRQPDGTLSNLGTDYYTNFSVWDTYRSTHPFYVLMYPSKNNDFVLSILDRYKHEGILTTAEYAQDETWCMIGNHSVPLLAEVYLKGLLPEKNKEMAEAIYTSLTVSHEKSDWEMYDKYGYYPFDLLPNESVSRTLEHTYDDYCAALVAEREGSDRYPFFHKRADYFKNLFDPSTGLMRAKDSKGNWRTPFDPFLLSHESTSGGDYTEGNAWQYTWHVQHDIPGLMELMGGKDVFESKLDSLFFLEVQSLGGGFHGDVTGLMGQYAHGNEPSHHVAYLYDYTDSPYKTQEIIRDVFDRFYLTGRDGLCGNDDCGQMSTWYMFSALGFYPVDPVSGEYLIGAPQVKQMVLNLENGKQFVMKANNLSVENKYVASITLNGKPLEGFKIKYDQIANGGELVFEMTSVKSVK